MAIEKVVNIVVKDNVSIADKHVKDLDKSLNSLQGASSGVTDSMKESSLSVLENGGAMGLLNDATGGLAMTVKDAVEATALFAKQSKISTAIQAAYATVVGASTGAMKIFRLALVGTGIGAIVVGLGLLIANFDKVKQVVFNLIPGLANVAEFIGGVVESITDFIGVTSESERALARLTEQADKSLAMNKKYLQEEGDQLNKYTKQKLDAKNAYNEAIKEEGANQVKLAKRLGRELLAIDKQHEEELAKTRKEKQDKADEESKKNSDKAKDDKIKANEAAVKAAEKAAENLLNQIKTDAQKAYDIDQEAKQVMVDITDFRNAENERREENEAAASANAYARMVADADEKKAFEAKQREEKILAEQVLHDTLFKLANGVADSFDALESLGMKKSKTAQVMRKGLALVDIGISTAKAFGSAIEEAKAAGLAAQLAAPMVPGIGVAASIASYASSAAMILGNVAKAKAILSSGNASGGGGSGGDGGRPSTPPQFNIVGQNSNNQLAQSIGKSQNRPVEAFVVSGNVTTAQSLDRNRIATATFNN